MTFNSIQFLLFLPLVLLLFYALPRKSRWISLLVMSYVFYAGWKVEYLALLLYSTATEFFISNFIYRSKTILKKRIWLAFSLISNFGVLILFKYFHFLIGGSAWFKALANDNESFLYLQFIFEFGIPVGISFYTFQTVSYAIDVYRGRTIPERNFAKFALFVNFFPQLVAGPIERFEHLHPQLFNAPNPTFEIVKKAFRLMLYGFFLKMVIADNFGDIIAPLYLQPKDFDLYSRVIGALLFGFQIYADFFGYTLIAIGVAHLFGVKLQDNFRSPYSSYSLKEFWDRWHISLSTWFRDYIYIPLGGNKTSKGKWIFAIILTFGLSGLWHGASVTFIYWGLFHGIYYLIEQTFFPIPKGKKLSFFEKTVRWSTTFTAVMFGWILFRANQFWVFQEFGSSLGEKSLFDIKYLLLLIPVALFFASEVLFRKSRIDRYLSEKSSFVRWTFYAVFFLCILLFNSRGDMQFIYFQF
ncbi:MAG: MBOAT family O-acyltransferase [Bacteroidota bacterium]